MDSRKPQTTKGRDTIFMDLKTPYSKDVSSSELAYGFNAISIKIPVIL